MFRGKIAILCFVFCNVIQEFRAHQLEGSCIENSDILKFEQGKSYVFDFSSFTTVHQSAHIKGSKIYLHAEASLTKIGPCEFILSLEKLRTLNKDLQGPEVPERLSKTAVRFFWRNGVIHEVFVSNSEDVWLVNVKRAILSVLQNSAFSATRVDAEASTVERSISGDCPTKHGVLNANTPIYTKTVELNECSHREKSPLHRLGIPYSALEGNEKTVHSLPLLNSTSNCLQTLDKGIITHAKCKEHHTMNVEQGSRYPKFQWFTKVNTILRLLSVVNEKYTSEETTKMIESANTRCSILYDPNETNYFSNGETLEGNAENKTKAILKRMEGDEDTAADYIKFLEAFKQLENPMELYLAADYVLTKKTKMIFLNGAAETDTIAALLFMRSMIQSDTDGKFLRNSYKIKFYKTISFSAHPKEEGLEALDTLIESAIERHSEMNHKHNMNDRLILAASGYAHQYCLVHRHSCQNSASYISLSDKIANLTFVDDCVPKHFRYNIPIAALNALGNLKHLSPKSVQAIRHILNGDHEDWFKIVALQAYRQDPCQSVLKESTRDMMTNEQLSSDLRINAYLALSKCMHQDDIKAVEMTIKNNKITEVGKFIISHLSHAAHSHSPSKKNQQLFVKTHFAHLISEVRHDAILEKHSQHMELSAFDKEKNLGFSAGLSVIYGNSSIPSAILDVTVDVLGRSYNILEASLSLRTTESNDDHQLEAILSTHENFLSNSHNIWKSIKSALHSRDSSYRRFGVTTAVGHVHRIRHSLFMSLHKVMQSIKVDGSSLEIVKAKPHKFLDIGFTYPTISGLPLNLEAQGASEHSIKMDLRGKFDLNEWMHSPAAAVANFSSDIFKSWSLSIKKSMKVGKQHFTPIAIGILTETNLHTVVDYGLDVNKNGISFMELKFRIPRRNLLTFGASAHTIFFEDVNGNFSKVAPESSLPRIASYAMRLFHKSTPTEFCFDIFPRIAGLEPCVSILFPSSNTELFAFQYNYTLSKHEYYMEGYEMKFQHNHDLNEHRVSFTFDTPGSTTNRKVLTEFAWGRHKQHEKGNDTREYTFAGRINSPWTKEMNLSYFFNKSRLHLPELNNDSLKVYTHQLVLQLEKGQSYAITFGHEKLKHIVENETRVNYYSAEHPDYFKGYKLDLEYFPTPDVVENYFHVAFSRDFDHLSVNKQFEMSAGGDNVIAEYIGDIKAVLYKSKDLTANRKFKHLEFNMNSSRSGDVNVIVDAEGSLDGRSYLKIISTLEVNEKTFEYNYTREMKSEYSEELRRLVHFQYSSNMSYLAMPEDRRILHSSLYEFNRQNDTNDNRKLHSEWSDSKSEASPIEVTAEFTHKLFETTGTLEVDVSDVNVVKATLHCASSDEGATIQAHHTASVTGVMEIDWKTKTENYRSKIHSEINIQYLTSNKWTNISTDWNIKHRGLEKNCQIVWGKGDENLGHFESNTTIEFRARKLGYRSVKTEGNNVTTTTANASLARHLHNGHSRLKVAVERPDGNVETFMLQKHVESRRHRLQSSIHAHCEDSAGKIPPVDFKWSTLYAAHHHHHNKDFVRLEGCQNIISTQCNGDKPTFTYNCALGVCAELKGIFECEPLFDEEHNHVSSKCTNITDMISCNAHQMELETPILCSTKKACNHLHGVYDCTYGSCSRIMHSDTTCAKSCSNPIPSKDSNVIVVGGGASTVMTAKCDRAVTVETHHEIWTAGGNSKESEENRAVIFSCAKFRKANDDPSVWLSHCTHGVNIRADRFATEDTVHLNYIMEHLHSEEKIRGLHGSKKHSRKGHSTFYKSDIRFTKQCPEHPMNFHKQTMVATKVKNGVFALQYRMKMHGLKVGSIKGHFGVLGPHHGLRNHGVIRMSGSIQSAKEENELAVRVKYDKSPKEYASSSQMNYIIINRNLENGTETVLIKGEANQTRHLKSFLDFEILENEVVIVANETFHADKVLRMNKEGFLLACNVSDGTRVLEKINFHIQFQEKPMVEQHKHLEYKPFTFNHSLTK